jgi:hypothetical protein
MARMSSLDPVFDNKNPGSEAEPGLEEPLEGRFV